MMTIDFDADAIARLCRKHHIRGLSLFGSHLRGEHRPDSDLDLLVEFEPGHVPGFGFVAIERELSEIFEMKVDLRTHGDLNHRFRDDVCRTAEPIYAAH
ncbi:MAG TPA: nucleotidyltransferase family protein [Thermoanaerobaculia bacterium]|nr:nucleotidyltransferase family protein [Thermoanaerobaculia bacterium]